MNWLVKPLQDILEWSFEFLQLAEWTPNTIFIIVILFGLAYWTFFWQPKYNKEAESNSDQLQ